MLLVTQVVRSSVHGWGHASAGSGSGGDPPRESGFLTRRAPQQREALLICVHDQAIVRQEVKNPENHDRYAGAPHGSQDRRLAAIEDLQAPAPRYGNGSRLLEPARLRLLVPG